MKWFLFCSILFFAVCSSNRQSCEEWPGWRGPRHNGTWQETGVLKKFNKDHIPIKWSVQVSAGYSGPSVADGLVFITERLTRPEEMERVLCFDAKTGKLIWSHAYSCEYTGIGYPAGPRASVIINEHRAYSLGTMGNLFCFESKTGHIYWQKDLNKLYQIRMPTWGISAAPLIVDDKIILNIGGSGNACIVALDKETGEEIWTNLEDDTSYSAPILIEQAGKHVVVVWTGQHVVGLDPVGGSVYWQQEFRQDHGIINIASPVFYNNYIFVSSFFDGSMLLKLDTASLSAEIVWKRKGEDERHTDALHCCISTPLLKGDYIYGVDSYGELRCLELKTGNRVWENLTAVKPGRWANIHFIQNNDLTYMFNEQGELIIAGLSDKGFFEISRAKLINPTLAQLNRGGIGVAWAHPAFAYKHVFIRSDSELLCADLSAD